MEEQFDFYPQKPALPKKENKSGWSMTLLSLVLFVASFMILFSDRIQFLVFLIVVLFIHEMGHFLFMKLFKYNNVKMMFVPLMGAFVQGVKKIYSQKESFFVILGGPVPGILFGIIGSIFAIQYEMGWLLELSGIFMILNMINLLPLDPLDGGQLFRLLVKYDHDLFLMIFSLVSSLILISAGFFADSWPLMLFGFLMSFRVRSIQKKYIIRKEFTRGNINYRVPYEELSNKEYSMIRNIVLEYNPALKKYNELSGSSNDLLVAENVNSVLETPLIMDSSVFFKIGVVLTWIFCLCSPILLFVFFGESLKWYFN
jgi:stage IV sporulation protein FB